MRDEYQIMLIAWVLVSGWVAFVIFANRKVHPEVLFYLFMVELWERFSYYGMRALLVLYLTGLAFTGGFGLKQEVAYGIYAAYGALVYLTPLVGGYLADKILGFRRAIIIGAVLMAAGQFVLSTSSGTEYISQKQYEMAQKEGKFDAGLYEGRADTGNEILLYLGLALLVTGNGFFKPNISSLIGKFYPQGDPRRDGAFTIFYMGINIGAFLTPLTCATVGEVEGWHYGFLLAGIGMVIGLMIFLYTSSQGFLERYADPPGGHAEPTGLAEQPVDAAAAASAAMPRDTLAPAERRRQAPSGTLLVLLGTLLFLPVAGALIRWNDAMDFLLFVVGLVAMAHMIYLSFEYPVVERQRMWVIIVLLLFTAVFWSFFELAGSALNIFTRDNVNKTMAGVELTTTFFQSVNALFIMIFAPVFAWMWVKMAQAGWEPPAPVKFSAGLILLGAGFLVLNLGKPMAVAGVMPAIFLILLYLLHTLGELTLSPVGLSMVTKLAPERIVGFMMGFWFLSSAIAHQAGKHIAKETVAPADATPEQTMDLAISVFNNVGLFALGSGVLLLLLSPILTKWMHGIK